MKMPFKIVKTDNGWIMNDNGDVMIKDSDNDTCIWVPHNMISFNNQNKPQFQNTDEPLEYSVVATDPVVHENNQSTAENTENGFNLSETHPSNENLFHRGECSQGQMDGENLKNIWGHKETLNLIDAVEQHYDDMYHIQRRKTFWNVISEKLNSQNITFSEQACKTKWLNLLRTYKSTKDNKNKTGRGPSRFAYFDRLDELLGDLPTNSSPHSIDVSELVQNNNNIDKENVESSDNSCNSENTKKRKNPTMELVKIKRLYYEKKNKQLEQKEETRNVYITECLKNKSERLELLKKKVELEERKVAVLEQLLNK